MPLPTKPWSPRVLTVVGDEHHDGGVGHAGGREMVEDAPDVVVEADGHAVVGGAHRTPGRRAHPRVVQRRGADDAVDARTLRPHLPLGDVQRFAAKIESYHDGMCRPPWGTGAGTAAGSYADAHGSGTVNGWCGSGKLTWANSGRLSSRAESSSRMVRSAR